MGKIREQYDKWSNETFRPVKDSEWLAWQAAFDAGRVEGREEAARAKWESNEAVGHVRRYKAHHTILMKLTGENQAECDCALCKQADELLQKIGPAWEAAVRKEGAQ